MLRRLPVKTIASTLRGRPNLRQFAVLQRSTPSVDREETRELMQAIHDGKLQEIYTALGHGFDPNCRLEENVTPLMIAAEDNEVPIISLLVKYGADVNLQDDLGETALMKASRNNHVQTVSFLLDQGAQSDILNYENMKARDTTLNVEVDKLLAAEEHVPDHEEHKFNDHDPAAYNVNK